MAHEMMHAWLRLSGYQRLSKKVEEGICQVMAYMWLDAEIGPSDSAAGHVASEFPSDEQLGVFFKYRIEVDDSPDYGEGFKLAHRAVKEYGLKETLHCMQLTGGFPL
ncbi:hypothetical protein SAY86_009929 [Trapa natans]|uniref:Protein DA1-like domain-containing protein n=1 Tax=Trapa natans TaxID=22666 RepID=A0AAN7QQ26_TRANT|nr:hypothetical protein SAY86_009929 [Trapa natans]